MVWPKKPSQPKTFSQLVKKQKYANPLNGPARSARYTSSGTARLRESYGDLDEWRATAKEVLERDGYRCVECGKHKSETSLHVHHITRLSRGGTSSKANLATLCSDCHSAHHSHMHR